MTDEEKYRKDRQAEVDAEWKLLEEGTREDEARWFFRKFAAGAVRYPRMAKAIVDLITKDEITLLSKELLELRAAYRLEAAQVREELQKLNDRLYKAALLVKEIDARTRPKAAQPQRR